MRLGDHTRRKMGVIHGSCKFTLSIRIGLYSLVIHYIIYKESCMYIYIYICFVVGYCTLSIIVILLLVTFEQTRSTSSVSSNS